MFNNEEHNKVKNNSITIRKYIDYLKKKSEEAGWDFCEDYCNFDVKITNCSDRWGIVFTGKFDKESGIPEITVYHYNNERFKRFSPKIKSTSGFDYHIQFSSFTNTAPKLMRYFKRHSIGGNNLKNWVV